MALLSSPAPRAGTVALLPHAENECRTAGRPVGLVVRAGRKARLQVVLAMEKADQEQGARGVRFAQRAGVVAVFEDARAARRFVSREVVADRSGTAGTSRSRRSARTANSRGTRRSARAACLRVHRTRARRTAGQPRSRRPSHHRRTRSVLLRCPWPHPVPRTKGCPACARRDRRTSSPPRTRRGRSDTRSGSWRSRSSSLHHSDCASAVPCWSGPVNSQEGHT